MSTLQDLVDQQELEFFAAVTDIKNAIDKFGPEIIAVAYLQSVAATQNDLTNVVIPDTMYVQ